MPATRREFLNAAGVVSAAAMFDGCGPIRLPDNSHCPLPDLPATVSGHLFENWSRTIRFGPKAFVRPRCEAEVQRLVTQSFRDRCCVRTQGAGHSFSQLLPTADTLVTLDDLKPDGVIRVDGHRVTVSGGLRLRDLIRLLRRQDPPLGLRNLGSITRQSIAGATATGTHGSGLTLGALSTQVAGMRLVDGTSTARVVTGSDQVDLAAARISLGALGIVTQVMLDCVPDYLLEYTAYATDLEDIIQNIDELNQNNDRVVVWWFVNDVLPRDFVILITKNAVRDGSRLLSSASEGRKRLRKDDTSLLRSVARESTKGGRRRLLHFVRPYDEVLTIPLLPVYHRECEYAIPISTTARALKMLRAVVEEGDISLRLPIELRTVDSDDVLLSPCRGRRVCYIGASTLVNSTEVFERFEPLMKSLEGRPHWGKNFTATQDEVQRWYGPGYDDFVRVRATFDPQRVFSNSMLNELFP